MSKPRSFTKAELMDAARAAAETGLSVTLSPTGEIVFTHETRKSILAPKTPETMLEGWLNESNAGGRA